MNAAGLYQQNTIITQNQAQLVTLLYEGAIRFLKQARRGLINSDYQEKSRLLARAQEIIFELNASLDIEAGGSLARNLRSLYAFIWKRLNEINIRNDAVLLERIIRILEDLAGAWKQITV